MTNLHPLFQSIIKPFAPPPMSTETPFVEPPRTINSLADALEAVRTKRILSPGDGLRAQAYIRQLRDTAPELLEALQEARRWFHAARLDHQPGGREFSHKLQSVIANATKTITQP